MNTLHRYLTWKHIKSYHAGQDSQQPSLHDGNHNMSIFSLFNKYAQIEQCFHPKKFSNHEPSRTEVDWGDHDSSFFLSLAHIDYDAKPKEFFTQELWGELQQRTCSTPLMKYLNDSLDNGQTEDNFSTSNQSRNIEVHTLFLTLNTLKVATIYLLSGTLGRQPGNLQPSPYKISSLVEISKQDL